MNVKAIAWTLWVLMTVISSSVFAYSMFTNGSNANVFLPGKTTHGHHQIEMACSVCHTETNQVKEEVCTDCHSADLEKFNDSHPKRKFTDPRNADRLLKLDASKCITCHKEHVHERTGEMGVTVPQDYCLKCHEDVAEERPTHKGLTFDTCATAGCHNYHDNTALYESFLIKHGKTPNLLDRFLTHTRVILDNKKSLTTAEADFSSHGGRVVPGVLEGWTASAHAVSGVNCSDCHQAEGKWLDKPTHENCSQCHDREVKGFKEGFHGMRLQAGLSPMRPAMADIAMHKGAAHKKLDCVACHGSHEFNREEASYQSCVKCHNDQHTNMYTNSKHFMLWVDKGLNGGVSCATCHMPRLEDKSHDRGYFVQHNQNENLRPNEKMIRSVCMNCHGLEFSIDALADQDLVKRNFIGQPSRHIESIDMANSRNISTPQ